MGALSRAVARFRLQQVVILQCPTGFAKTNNSVESFNKVIMRDYDLKANSLVRVAVVDLLKMTKNMAVTPKEFALSPVPSVKLMSRSKKLIKEKKLAVIESFTSVLLNEDGVLMRRTREAEPYENANEQRADTLPEDEEAYAATIEAVNSQYTVDLQDLSW
jgi:hypothetical protein